MKESIVRDITKDPEVEGVTPMLMQAVFDPNKGESGGMAAYLGVDPATFPKLKSALPFKAGGWFKDPDAARGRHRLRGGRARAAGGRGQDTSSRRRTSRSRSSAS